MKSNIVKPGQGSLPQAVDIANLPLPGEIVYPWHLRLQDWWAGKRDAKLLRAMLERDPVLLTTPWMHGLAKGFETAAVKGRKHATTRQSELRLQAAHLVEQYHSIIDSLDELQADADRVDNHPELSTEATTTAELHETEEQRLHRRQREADKRIEAAQAKVSAAKDQLRSIRSELAALEKQWDLQESLYWATEEALRDYYSKRQDVYIRAGLHGRSNDGIPAQPPEIVKPGWIGDPLPTLDVETPDRAEPGIEPPDSDTPFNDVDPLDEAHEGVRP